MSKPYNVKYKGRHYKSPDTGNDLPSVTNILNEVAKPLLVPWAAKEERLLVIKAATAVHRSFPGAPPEKFQRLLESELKNVKKAHKKLMEDAATFGTKLHETVAAELKAHIGDPHEETPTLEGTELWAYMAWEDWWLKNEIKPIAVEKFVWSDEYGYAGTTDLIAEVKLTDTLFTKIDPKHRTKDILSHAGETVFLLCDLKTSKRIYDEVWMQIAAYIEAYHCVTDAPEPMWGMVLRLPKTEEDPEFEIRLLPPEEMADKFSMFMAYRQVWEGRHRGV